MRNFGLMFTKKRQNGPPGRAGSLGVRLILRDKLLLK